MEPLGWVVSGQAHTQDPHGTGDPPDLQLFGEFRIPPREERIQYVHRLSHGVGSGSPGGGWSCSSEFCPQVSPAGDADARRLTASSKSSAPWGVRLQPIR